MLDLQTEQHELGQPYLELYEAVVDLNRRHDLHPLRRTPCAMGWPCGAKANVR